MKTKILALFLIFLFSEPLVLAADVITPDNLDEQTIQYTKQVDKLKGSLFVDDTIEAQAIVDKQQEADVQDLETIWNAVVDKNQVIKFSLQKLAIPEEQRRVHSSLMAKSLSALISGAAILPSFMGMHYAIQSASYAGARLANNYLNKETHDKLQNPPITDTEAIELAGLIEDLQNEIVVAYYDYKSSLNQLKDVRSQMILYNKNYNNALKNGDKLEIAVSSALWDEQVIEEYRLVQEVKKNQLLLQRLAGKEAVDNLKLVQYNLDVHNINVNDLDFEAKQKVKTKVEVQK
jgi:hypothetical protein